MTSFSQILSTSVKIAFQELSGNKLRTFLSLLGITIGIFCIVSVFTVLDSMEQNIKNNVSSLGSDVLYISKWPWMDDHGEYRWWDFQRRPVMTEVEYQAINKRSRTAAITCLMITDNGLTGSHNGNETNGITAYAVTTNFEKLQNFDIAQGRYFNPSELNGGNFKVVLGHDVYQSLFANQANFEGQTVTLQGRKFQVIGVLKSSGSNMTGFDWNTSVIYPYLAQANIKNVTGLNAGSTLIIKGKSGIPTSEVSSEIQGILRTVRKLGPGTPDNFAINQLSQVTQRIESIFAMVNIVGSIIAFFSLLVGGFGIANIMFVTVKERTKTIGLKKAIGAPSSSILTEFLIEAVILCIIGGLIGIIIVLILSFFISSSFDFPITLSLKNFIIGIGISSIVGLISGFIPARAASRLDPVVAIRTN